MMTEKMEAAIKTLIEDNILNFKLISTLSKMGIEASSYYVNNVYVIMDLLQIEDELKRKTFHAEFFGMIRHASKLNPVTESQSIRNSAHSIFKTLTNYLS